MLEETSSTGRPPVWNPQQPTGALYQAYQADRPQGGPGGPGGQGQGNARSQGANR